MSKTINVVTIIALILVTLLYGVFIIIAYNRKAFIFGPYNQPPPGPDDEVFRPGGVPTPVTPETIQARLDIVNSKQVCNRAN